MRPSPSSLPWGPEGERQEGEGREERQEKKRGEGEREGQERDQGCSCMDKFRAHESTFNFCFSVAMLLSVLLNFLKSSTSTAGRNSQYEQP